MRTLFFSFLLAASLPFASSAQKFAYVDTEYILQHVPDYAEAQGELNRFSSEWQEEIELKYESVRKLEEALALEKILLTQEMIKKREEEITTMRQQAMQMQKQKFGVGGELFNQREQLIKPIQDQIFDAIKEVASSRGYMVIFDKSKNSNILYSNPKYDVSEKIIKGMGLTPGELIEQPNQKDGGEKGTNSDKSNTKQTPGRTGAGNTSGGKTSTPSRDRK